MSGRSLSVYYQNARGLRTKLIGTYSESLYIDYDILMISETSLCEGILSSEVLSERYTIYRRDRVTETVGGGVMIAVRSSLQSARISVPHDDCEELYVSVSIGNRIFIFCCLYIPPRSGSAVYLNHVTNIEDITQRYPGCNVCSAGDFNLPKTSWTYSVSEQCAVPYSVSYRESEFCDNMIFCGFMQNSTVPNEYNGSTLDLVWTNKEPVVVVKSDYCFVKPDVYHPPIEFNLSYKQDGNNMFLDNAWKYDFKRANFDDINEFLGSVDWDTLFSEFENIDDCVAELYWRLYAAVDKYVHKFLVNATKFPSWYSLETKNAIKLKNRLLNKYKNSQLTSHYERYKAVRSQSKLGIDKDYKHFLNKTQENIKSNPKFFWRYINDKKSNKSGLPREMKLGDTQASNKRDICNLFADFFKSVYQPQISQPLPEYNVSHFSNSVSLNTVLISPDIVFKKLIGLNDSYCLGPDGICNYFLKRCSPSLSYPLAILYHRSMLSGCFPSLWKKSYVLPLHKSGKLDDVRNYRPISCLPGISKIFESIVTDRLFEAFKNYISPEQHGFFSGRSTETNLLVYSDAIFRAVESGNQVDSVYVDFRKAFDSIDHRLLCYKLSLIGVCGGLHDWISSYLVDRFQQVRIDDTLSYEFRVTSGVPQGSHCAPILFSLFMCDLPHNFRLSFYSFFADDLKMSKVVRDFGDTADLQSDLCELVTWCNKNRMTLNPTKCKVITFHRGENPISYDYELNGVVLDRVTSIADLGVIFDSSLRFNLHIDSAIHRAFRLCGFIKRQTRDFKDIFSVKTLYVHLVRPILEYGSLVWNPYYNNSIDRLERVQRKMVNYMLLKMNVNKDDFDYLSRLKIVGLQSLRDRRLNRQVVFAFKVIHGMVDCTEVLAKFNFRVPSYSVRNSLLLEPEYHRTNYGKSSPFNDMFRSVNSVAAEIDLFSISLSALKKYLAVREPS